jgi:hypothetical protein
MTLSVRDGALESTTRCLSSEKSDITGTYSLDGHLTGHGKRERLAQTLSGGFDLVARDGKFIRAAGVGATFDYLNRTGDFNVAFPDLNKEAFPYDFISAKGTVERPGGHYRSPALRHHGPGKGRPGAKNDRREGTSHRLSVRGQGH